VDSLFSTAPDRRSLRQSLRSISSARAILEGGISVALRKSACKRGFGRYIWKFHGLVVAGVAQSAEHRFCKPTVVSSTLTASSFLSSWASAFGRRITGGNIDRHRDGSSETGWIPKWLKGPDCKSGGIAFAGSNPAPPMPRGFGDSLGAHSVNNRPFPNLGPATPVDGHSRWARTISAGVTQW
jgi:hypothetical protein